MTEEFSLDKIKEERKARKAEMDKAREAKKVKDAAGGDASPGKPEKAGRLIMKKDIDYYAIPVCSWEYAQDYLVHGKDASGKWSHLICREHFREQCPECEVKKEKKREESKEEWQYRAVPTNMMLYHIVNFVGAHDSFKDPATGKDVNFEYKNFVRKVEIPHGAKDCNIKELRKIFKKGKAQEKFLRFNWSSDREVGLVIEEVEREDVAKVFSHIDLPEVSSRFLSLSKQEIREILLKDFVGLPEGFVTPPSTVTVTKETVVDDPFGESASIESAFS